MHWLLWILIGPIMLVVIGGHIDSSLSRLQPLTKLNLHPGANTGCLIIYLPGILADGEESCKPLMKTWLARGDVLTVSYDKARFVPIETAEIVADALIDFAQANGYIEYKFIGSSMGGLLTLDVWNVLRRPDYRGRGGDDIIATSTAIIVDSPSGSRDMLGGGNIAAPLMRMMRFGRFFNVISRPLMRAMFKGPKRENTDESLDYTAIYERAMAQLRSFPLSGWRDCMAYMAAHRGPQTRDFEGIRHITYVNCNGDNETVRQPNAATAWAQAAMTTARSVVRIECLKVAHCSYSEQLRLWNRLSRCFWTSLEHSVRLKRYSTLVRCDSPDENRGFSISRVLYNAVVLYFLIKLCYNKKALRSKEL